MTSPAWQPIATAPDLDRVFVAGWQPRHGNTAGYWWWHEDLIVGGVPAEHPNATLWCEITLPAFPAPREGTSA
jgi:hypothetical protein